MTENAANRIVELAHKTRDNLQAMADMVNQAAGTGQGPAHAGPDHQPQAFNDLCARAISYTNEIAELVHRTENREGPAVRRPRYQ